MVKVKWYLWATPTSVSMNDTLNIMAKITDGGTGEYRLIVGGFGETFTSRAIVVKKLPATIAFPITVPVNIYPGKHTLDVTLQYWPVFTNESAGWQNVGSGKLTVDVLPEGASRFHMSKVLLGLAVLAGVGVAVYMYKKRR